MDERRPLTAQERDAAGRLRRLWDERKRALGLTQDKAATRLGWESQSAVSNYLNGKRALSPVTVKKFADLLGVSPLDIAPWMEGFFSAEPQRIRIDQATERGAVRDLDTSSLPVPGPAGTMGDASNIEPAPDGHQDRGRSVPLISWANASFGLQAHDHLEPGDAHRWVRCDRTCSRYTYALTVRGDSMWPVYMEHDIIFVDPERQPEHNRDVVVRNSTTDDVTLKRFVQDGTRAYLKALNKDYPEPIRLVSEEDRFCGVVIQMKRDM